MSTAAARVAPRPSGEASPARLSPQLRRQWEHDGFLLLRASLSRSEVDRALAAAAALSATAEPGHVLNVFNIVEKDDAFLDIVDHPSVLGIVADLMGANLQLLISQLMIRPPTPSPPLGWHHDGSKPYPFPCVGAIAPLLNLKIGWFLTDVTSHNEGNLTVVPGSHQRGVQPPGVGDALEHSAAETTETLTEMPGAVQITAKAGDAILFHNGLWHSVAPSTVARDRIVLYYGYGPSWLRLNDRLAPTPEVLARCSPVRQQLLGGLSHPGDHGGMHPGDAGLPLLALLGDGDYTTVMEREFREELANYSRSE